MWLNVKEKKKKLILDRLAKGLKRSLCVFFKGVSITFDDPLVFYCVHFK